VDPQAKELDARPQPLMRHAADTVVGSDGDATVAAAHHEVYTSRAAMLLTAPATTACHCSSDAAEGGCVDEAGAAASRLRAVVADAGALAAAPAAALHTWAALVARLCLPSDVRSWLIVIFWWVHASVVSVAGGGGGATAVCRERDVDVGHVCGGGGGGGGGSGSGGSTLGCAKRLLLSGGGSCGGVSGGGYEDRAPETFLDTAALLLAQHEPELCV